MRFWFLRVGKREWRNDSAFYMLDAAARLVSDLSGNATACMDAQTFVNEEADSTELDLETPIGDLKLLDLVNVGELGGTSVWAQAR